MTVILVVGYFGSSNLNFVILWSFLKHGDLTGKIIVTMRHGKYGARAGE